MGLINLPRFNQYVIFDPDAMEAFEGYEFLSHFLSFLIKQL